MNDLIKSNKIDFGLLSSRLASAERKIKDVSLGNSNKLQVATCFDITGSTFSYFELFKSNSEKIIKSTNKYMAGTEFALYAMRNHGDENYYQEIFYENVFTNDLSNITPFLSKIKSGGGGLNALCCLEDVLKRMNLLRWQPTSNKVAILFVDEPPNSSRVCPYEINWLDEVENLIKKGVKIHTIFVGDKEKSRNFYQNITEKTGGRLFEIGQIDDLISTIVAITLSSNRDNLGKYLIDLRREKRISEKDSRNITLLLK